MAEPIPWADSTLPLINLNGTEFGWVSWDHHLCLPNDILPKWLLWKKLILPKLLHAVPQLILQVWGYLINAKTPLPAKLGPAEPEPGASNSTTQLKDKMYAENTQEKNNGDSILLSFQTWTLLHFKSQWHLSPNWSKRLTQWCVMLTKNKIK